MIEIDDHPELSAEAREHLDRLVQFFDWVRGRGHEFMAMLVPVDRGAGGCAIMYEGDALNRARQTIRAAAYVREHHHPTEVLWACDTFVRVVPKDELDERMEIPAAEDPLAEEALLLGHAQVDGRGVNYVKIPYGWDDGGRLLWRRAEPWFTSGHNPMDAAVACAVVEHPILEGLPRGQTEAELEARGVLVLPETP